MLTRFCPWRVRDRELRNYNEPHKVDQKTFPTCSIMSIDERMFNTRISAGQRYRIMADKCTQLKENRLIRAYVHTITGYKIFYVKRKLYATVNVEWEVDFFSCYRSVKRLNFTLSRVKLLQAWRHWFCGNITLSVWYLNNARVCEIHSCNIQTSRRRNYGGRV